MKFLKDPWWLNKIGLLPEEVNLLMKLLDYYALIGTHMSERYLIMTFFNNVII
jgi:hypothetical protein